MQDPLSTLNAAQREAVLHGEGPLLILAGAGTGKTRVLTHRIGHLLRSGLAQPDQVLALTFTEKAALEMQERLDILLPYGTSELWVKTFHGFCEAILRESGHEIGLDSGYRVLTQADALLFLKEHLFEFDLHHYRPLGNPLRFLSVLLGHFGQLMEELVSPEAYGAWAERLATESTDDAERERAAKHHELARAYAHYLDLLPQHSALDFASLQYFTHQLLERRPSVLRALQERFRFCLVDEFQDTNTIQNRIVERLCEAHQNLMVVGDDDQSIYRWRGASLQNILHFESRFPTAKRILLTENYRSTQPILDASYASIQHNNPHRLEAREGLDKRLQSRLEFPDPSPKPHVVHFEHGHQEARFVVARIRTRVESSPGLHYRDMAILVRAGAHAAPFLETLDRSRIPYTFSGSQGLYQREVIKDVLALMRFLANPADDVALFRVLSLPIFGVTMEFLLAQLQRARSLSLPLLQVVRRPDPQSTLFADSASESSLKNALTLLQSLREQAKTQPTSQLLGHFFKATGTLTRFEESTEAEDVQALEHLATFSQLIRNFEETHPEGRLLNCLADLEARADLGERPSSPEESLELDTVKVFTVHAAKGLEFDTVFLVDLVAQRFPSQNRKDPIEFPEDLLGPSSEEEAVSHLAEERRLFYVGMTRAKHQLFLTHSDYYDGRKRWKRSIFLEELEPSETVDVTEEGASLLAPSHARTLLATDSPAEPPLSFTYARLQGLLTTSYSKLQTFQICPLKYKFRYVYQLPEPASHAASFGSSLHNTLNAFYRAFPAKGHPTLEALQRAYASNWISAGYLSRAHHEARKAQGWTLLQTFFDSHEGAWTRPAYLEKAFKFPVGTDLIISGRIDRIDALPDGSYEVIDYKTGELKDDLKLDKDLQLSIYALACEKTLKLPVSKLSLYFLIDNKKVSTTRTPEQLASTEAELLELSQALRASAFEATPSPYACGFCDYRLLCEKSAV